MSAAEKQSHVSSDEALRLMELIDTALMARRIENSTESIFTGIATVTLKLCE